MRDCNVTKQNHSDRRSDRMWQVFEPSDALAPISRKGTVLLSSKCAQQHTSSVTATYF